MKTVGTPSSARVGPAWRKPGWNAAAKANVMPVRARVAATCSGSSVSAIPRDDSTSDDPEDELAALLPCLTTGTPVDAATTAAMVEMLTVP